MSGKSKVLCPVERVNVEIKAMRGWNTVENIIKATGLSYPTVQKDLKDFLRLELVETKKVFMPRRKGRKNVPHYRYIGGIGSDGVTKGVEGDLAAEPDLRDYNGIASCAEMGKAIQCFHIIRVLDEHRLKPLTAKEIVQITGAPIARVYRQLNFLQAVGWVVESEKRLNKRGKREGIYRPLYRLTFMGTPLG